MYISQLEITNFRNFDNASFEFSPGVNTLIGESGSGKSNVLYALRLLLDESLPINATKLVEKDFNQNLQEWKGQWIVLKLTFKDIDNDDSEVASFVAHNLEDPRTEKESIGTYALFYRPKINIRKKMFEYTQRIKDFIQKNQDTSEIKEELRLFLHKITLDDYESVLTSRLTGNFIDKESYKTMVGDFEKGMFPNPEEEEKALYGIVSPHISLIKKEVSCTYVQALRNVIVELRQKRTSPLLKLLRGTTKDIKIDKADDISNQVKELNKEISELDEISILSNKIKKALNRTLGYTYSPKVSIKSELPEEVDTLLNSLTLWVGDDFSSDQGKLDDLSLGGANLIYITLKLLEYEFYQNEEEKAAHFLLIEEPEAHIHTHVQKTLFEKYHFENTQVFITTHSTHISSASKIDSMNILIKNTGYTHVSQPSKNLDADTCRRIERYLDATRSNLLFAKGVILVEGDAELILIPAMFRKIFGISLDEIGISIINMNSTVFEHISKLFDDSRIQRNCAIITDLDTSVEILPDNPKKYNNEQKKMRNSEKSGQIRAEALNKLHSDNRWVKVFYATHTFEVDFVLNSNEYEIKATLPLIYKTDNLVKKVEKILDSESDEIISKETLRLAEKVGKGWFALLVSETINIRTYIPDYILDAIAFTCKHMTEEHLIAMASYRIQEITKYDEKEIPSQFDQSSSSLEDFMMILNLLTENDDKEDNLITLFKKIGIIVENNE